MMLSRRRVLLFAALIAACLLIFFTSHHSPPPLVARRPSPDSSARSRLPLARQAKKLRPRRPRRRPRKLPITTTPEPTPETFPFNLARTGPFTTLVSGVYDDDRFIMTSLPPLNSIPHILHLSWKDRRVPTFAYDNFLKWNATHPDWTVMYWTDADVHAYVEAVLKDSELGKLYRSFPKNIVKMDFSRYLILFTIGGVYADIDVTPLRRLDQVLTHHSCIIAREPEAFPVSIWMENTILASNFFMASRPGHPFWLYLMDKVKGRTGYPLIRAGPIAVTDSLKSYLAHQPMATRDGAVFLAPSLYFDPLHGEKGDQIHLDMLAKRCRGWERHMAHASPFSRRVCRVFTNEGRIDYEAMRRHPKFFNESFIRHGMFNSWNSNSAIRVKYRSMDDLGFDFTKPKYYVRRDPTPYDRERKIIKEGLD